MFCTCKHVIPILRNQDTVACKNLIQVSEHSLLVQNIMAEMVRNEDRLNNIYYTYYTYILCGAIRSSLGWSVDMVVVVQASQ